MSNMPIIKGTGGLTVDGVTHHIPCVYSDFEARENPLFTIDKCGKAIVDLRGHTVIADSIFLPMKRKASRSLWQHFLDVLKGESK